MNNQTLIYALPAPIQSIALSLIHSGVGVLLIGMLILTGAMNLNSTRKNKLSTGRFGKATERKTARRIGNRQRRQRKHDHVAFKVGTLNLPDAQQGIAVCGAPNSGKTFSVIDPIIRDAILQGLPIVVYDFKGSQLEAHAAYATAQGYDLHVFAPGYAYSGICNPLDFVQDASDGLMAGQLAEVIYKNTRRGNSAGENDFFSNAGQKLVEAVMLLAKTTPYPDLLMAKRLLNLPDLAARIQHATEQGTIPIWTQESFSQLVASGEAEKQVAGIIATAQRTFDKFISKELIPSFVGKTTIPIDLKGKQILFLQVDTQKRDVVAPLVAAILHLLIARNFSYVRTQPLVVSLDELPTLHLEGLPKWINEFRSAGFCPILGYQNFAQLQYTYGRELSRAIFAACGTKAFFNPRDDETATLISRYLGEKEVRMFTRSVSSAGQRSTSRNEQIQKAPLLSVDEVLKLDQGECVLINPAYKGHGEASVPLRLRVKVPGQEIKLQTHSERLWRTILRDRLTDQMRSLHIPTTKLDAAALERQRVAEEQFPLPKQKAKSNQPVEVLPDTFFDSDQDDLEF